MPSGAMAVSPIETISEPDAWLKSSRNFLCWKAFISISPANRASFGSLYSENLTISNFLPVAFSNLLAASSQSSLFSPISPSFITSLSLNLSSLAASALVCSGAFSAFASLFFAPQAVKPVSYTHLTLPTICSV